MPRFRPFVCPSAPDCAPDVDVVEVNNGKRHVSHKVLDDHLPDCNFYDLEKLVKSNDVRLDPMNPILFPAKRIDFSEPEVSPADPEPTPADPKNSNLNNED